jgi:hypothetical protein
MPQKTPISFEEFNRCGGRVPEKRGRDREETVRTKQTSHHTHTVRVFCTCCNKEIDLRTVHCNDCCDEDNQRRNGHNRRVAQRQVESDRNVGSSKKMQTESTKDRKRDTHTPQSTPSSIIFVPEGSQRKADVHRIRSLGAEEVLAQTRAVEESEADLIDLSIAPGQGE